ncbi:DinB family protein [Kutzneria sp. 744]|uniref:DinB family protein n=1 Tax=Kutzneria sp. (strain 744) TaxID=345341 RepID=UPI0003EEE0D6|nr:DinB family protein [Kutzneria sp. 744]EWM19585.1 mini-circle protein [Kutzneria sp. 744]
MAMLMTPPTGTDERAALLTFLASQRDALIAAVQGLTDADAGKTSTASALSPLALLRHARRTERRWVLAGLDGQDLPGEWPPADWSKEFVLDADDTIAACVAAYRETARGTEEIVNALPSLDVPCRNAQATEFNARWILLHLIEETARHAGHADIIRESLDGTTAPALIDLLNAAEHGL